MQYSVSETGEVTHAVADAFQDFDFVIAALGIAVSKTNVKGVEDQLVPVVNCSGTLSEFRQMRGFGAVDPVSKQLFSHPGVWRVHKEEEVVFEKVHHSGEQGRPHHDKRGNEQALLSPLKGAEAKRCLRKAGSVKRTASHRGDTEHLQNDFAEYERCDSCTERHILSAQKAQILDFISRSGQITETEIMELLGVKKTRAYTLAKQMCDEELIISVGRGVDKKYLSPC